MRRKAFAKSPGLHHLLSIGLFAGQTQTLVCFLVATALMLASAARPDLASSQRNGLANVLTPALSVFSGPFAALSEGLDYLFSLTRLKTEVAKLREENARLTDWYSVAQLLQAENTSLRDLLKVQLEPPLTFVTARVIGDMGGPYARTIMVGAGTQDGIARGDAVLGGEGLIGRISAAHDRSSTVLLINDVNSRSPVRVDGGNLQAILAGTNGQRLVLDRVPEGSTVNDGQRVLTSGIGGIFPPDLPVGTIHIEDDGALSVHPFADLGRLMFVRIVHMPQSAPAEVAPKPAPDKKGAKR